MQDDARSRIIAALPQRVEDALAEQQPSYQGRPAPYAPPTPPSRDPVVLAGHTVKSVYTIGGMSADEIEAAADEFEAGARKIGDQMRHLAECLRQSAEATGREVEGFATKATLALNGIRGLMAKMGEPEHEQEPPANE